MRSGLIDEAVYLQTDWYNVSLYWGLLREVVAEGRRVRPYTFENFEWLAAHSIGSSITLAAIIRRTSGGCAALARTPIFLAEMGRRNI